jgi:hypothetical protein
MLRSIPKRLQMKFLHCAGELSTELDLGVSDEDEDWVADVFLCSQRLWRRASDR